MASLEESSEIASLHGCPFHTGWRVASKTSRGLGPWHHSGRTAFHSHRWPPGLLWLSPARSPLGILAPSALPVPGMFFPRCSRGGDSPPSAPSDPGFSWRLSLTSPPRAATLLPSWHLPPALSMARAPSDICTCGVLFAVSPSGGSCGRGGLYPLRSLFTTGLGTWPSLN